MKMIYVQQNYVGSSKPIIRIPMMKKLTFNEAVKSGEMDKFISTLEIEHSHPKGYERFQSVLNAMIGKPKNQSTSVQDSSADYNDIQTPSHTSSGASRKRERASRKSKASDEPRTLQSH